jgi:predicted permease
VVYPQHFEIFSLLTFLFILGYNPVLWTLGKYLVTDDEEAPVRFELKKLITPPAAANIISLLLVLLGWQHIFPQTLVSSVDFLGQAAVPMATFVLGATLGSISIKQLPGLADVVRVLSVKYILLPLAVLFLLWYFRLGDTYPLLSDFLIIQSAAAPATGLILQVRAYGGNRQKVAGMMLIAYIVCLIALPFWIGLWHSL